jgi:hypothetical protein
MEPDGLQKRLEGDGALGHFGGLLLDVLKKATLHRGGLLAYYEVERQIMDDTEGKPKGYRRIAWWLTDTHLLRTEATGENLTVTIFPRNTFAMVEQLWDRGSLPDHELRLEGVKIVTWCGAEIELKPPEDRWGRNGQGYMDMVDRV